MYYHIWAEIDLDALQYNIDQISKLVPTSKIMAVVKANAYGHGAGVIAKQLEKAGVKHFAVSNIYEALDLRFAGIGGDILILGNIDFSAVKEAAENNITVCIYDTEYAKFLNSSAKKAGVKLKCHIKLDTGMGRLGLDCRGGDFEKSLKTQIEDIYNLGNLTVTGAFTHFATADRDNDNDGEYVRAQYDRLNRAKTIISSIGGNDDLIFHASNSAATLMLNTDISSDLYRAGIVLYGLTPSKVLELPITLKPVMSLKAVVTQVKTIKKGDSVSYGKTFTAQKDMKIATVTAGYADGYMRGLSNKGKMLINGKMAPIIGRVCMDQTMVDVSENEGVKTGDTAILFGSGLPVEEVASVLDTINYELVCAVAHRVPRIYFKGGKEIKMLRYRSV